MNFAKALYFLSASALVCAGVPVQATLVNNEDNNTTSVIPLGAPGPILIDQVPFQSTHFVSTDLNGDFYPDLVTADLNQRDVQVFINDSGNGFNAGQQIVRFNESQMENAQPARLFINDLDQDTFPDLIITYATNRDGFITVCFGNGAGGFENIVDVPTVAGTFTVSILDLNGDGTQDIFAGMRHIVQHYQDCPGRFNTKDWISITSSPSGSPGGAYFSFHLYPNELNGYVLYTSRRRRFQSFDVDLSSNEITVKSSTNTSSESQNMVPFEYNHDGIPDFVNRTGVFSSVSDSEHLYIEIPGSDEGNRSRWPYLNTLSDIDLDGFDELISAEYYLNLPEGQLPKRIAYNGLPLPDTNYESSFFTDALDYDLDGDDDLFSQGASYGISVRENLLLNGTKSPRSRAVADRRVFHGGEITGSLDLFQTDSETSTTLYVRTESVPWHVAGNINGNRWNYTPESGSGKYWIQSVSTKQNGIIGEKTPEGLFGFPEAIVTYNEQANTAYTLKVCCDSIPYDFPLETFVSATLIPQDLQTTGTVSFSYELLAPPAKKLNSESGSSGKASSMIPVFTVSQLDVQYTSGTLWLEFNPANYPDANSLSGLLHLPEMSAVPESQIPVPDPSNPWRVSVTVINPSGQWYVPSGFARIEDFVELDQN